MSNTLTVRLPDPLAQWLEERAKASGRSRASLVKEALEALRRSETQPFMSLAGTLEAAPDLSARKGFSPE